MGLREKRYGPLSTMVVVGRLVGTFEPALVIVTMAQASSASATTNTIAPSQPAGRSAGKNGKPPCERRPNSDLRRIWRVSHGWTVNPRSLRLSLPYVESFGVAQQ